MDVGFEIPLGVARWTQQLFSLLRNAKYLSRKHLQFRKSSGPKSREKVRIHLPPPQSLFSLESVIYQPQLAPIWPENHDSSSNQRITFPVTVPHLFPNSLNATVAVPFLSEVGPRVRRLAWMSKCSCKPNARKNVGFEIPFGVATRFVHKASC
jgi:hypothetical protein